ncbi:MAG: hypothetical protein KAW12_02540 [Candidatus Aminicenantes bacterium]|nr:hypothetical protein [Candidatus Aminicenantes bacterium]
MKSLYSFSLLLVCSVLFFTGCSSSQKPEKIFFQDKEFHFVIYTDPSRDCPVCIKQALETINNIDMVNATQDLNIIALKAEGTEYFVVNTKEKYPKVNVIVIEKPLPYPHPSVMVMKENRVFMFMYLPVDPYDMKNVLDKMRAFFDHYSF